MRAETYLNAYFATRDRLERCRLGGRTRARLVRQERKLEVRLRDACNEADSITWEPAWPGIVGGPVDTRPTYEEVNQERKALWVAVLLQMVAFLVLLAARLWA